MCRIIILILVCSFMYLINGQCTDEIANNYYKRSIYEFSMKLITRLAQEKENHFVASPFSTWSLLAALTVGAKGQTLAELRQVLRFYGHPCFSNRYFNIISNVLIPDDTTRFEKSSFIFIDEDLSVKPNFITQITQLGIADVAMNRVDDPASAAARINNYVSGGTGGMIPEIVTPDDFYNNVMFLVDALYFKGVWTTTFSDSETEVSQFYDDSGVKQIGDVNLMYLAAVVNTTILSPIKARVLELPYGANKRYVMLIFLPNFGSSVYQMLNRMERVSLRSIFNLFADNGPAKTIIQIPKFQMSSDLDNFKELLQDMGLNSLFESNALTEVAAVPLAVTEIKQKSVIDVNEEGTEASAATVVEAEFRSRSDEFMANKPFMYMIVDKPSEIPLFVGVYSKPSLL